MAIKALWKILAIIIAMLLMIVVPIMHAFESEDRFVKMALLDELDYFLDKISNSGEISPKTYMDFSNSLNRLGYPFDIELKHYKQVYVPVYENPSDFGSFAGEVHRVEELFTDFEIKDTLFPQDGKKQSSYKLQKGDYIVVTAKTDVKSKYQKLRQMLFLTSGGPVFFIRLASVVQNEAY